MFDIPSISTLSMIIIGLFGIGFLITIHEFGHFIMCQIFNIPTPRFAVGVGPTIFKKQFKRTLFSIGIIPVAGYVQIGNEDENSENDILDKNPLWKSALVMFGGILFNLLFAYIAIISISLFEKHNMLTTKFHPNPSLMIKNNTENTTHEPLIITECNNKKVYSMADVLLYASSSEKTNLTVFTKNNPSELYNITLDTQNLIKNETYNLSNLPATYPPSTMSKIITGIKITNNMVINTIKSYRMLFTNKNYKKISGIIGIVKSLSDSASKGFSLFISFLAIISVTLALANILPLPILDGGRFFLLVIKRLFPFLSFTLLENILLYGSLIIIGALTIFSTYYDIIHCFFN